MVPQFLAIFSCVVIGLSVLGITSYVDSNKIRTIPIGTTTIPIGTTTIPIETTTLTETTTGPPTTAPCMTNYSFLEVSNYSSVYSQFAVYDTTSHTFGVSYVNPSNNILTVRSITPTGITIWNNDTSCMPASFMLSWVSINQTNGDLYIVSSCTGSIILTKYTSIGQYVWSTNIGPSVVQRVELGNGVVYAPKFNNDQIVQYDSNTGSVNWVYQSPSCIMFNMYSDGTDLYVVGHCSPLSVVKIYPNGTEETIIVDEFGLINTPAIHVRNNDVYIFGIVPSNYPLPPASGINNAIIRKYDKNGTLIWSSVRFGYTNAQLHANNGNRIMEVFSDTVYLSIYISNTPQSRRLMTLSNTNGSILSDDIMPLNTDTYIDIYRSDFLPAFAIGKIFISMVIRAFSTLTHPTTLRIGEICV